ncbi:MAG: carboxypeptidase regulatory-like domain-containing protein [Armatimonadetes bacterium]|nr:carboxypeptidase regulatory-like domain-containing protein [Armatimonadota bacterium]
MKVNRILSSGSALSVAVACGALWALTAFGVTEEVPVGSVTGIAVEEGTDNPIAGAEVWLSPAYFELGADLISPITFHTNADGSFRFANVPVGAYSLTVMSPGYFKSEWVLVEEDRDEILTVRARWTGDQLYVSAGQSVYTPDESPEFIMNGLTRQNDVSVTVSRLPKDEIEKNADIYRLIRQIIYQRFDEDVAESVPELEEVQKRTFHLTTKDLQGRFAEVLMLDGLPEGTYVVAISTDDAIDYTWLTVSTIGLITKSSPGRVLAFAVDIESGEPLEGVEISLVYQGKRTKLGRTDEFGVVESDLPKSSGEYFAVIAERGESSAFAWFYDYGDSGTALAAYIQTDRPVYRPGDKVQYKATLREPTQNGYRVPSGRQVEVTIYDPDGSELEKRTASLTAFGAVDGSFDIPEEGLTGSYRIAVDLGSRVESKYVPVASYRKSEFLLSVQPGKPYYLVGETVVFVAKAEYYTGEPVVGAKVNASIFDSELWDRSPFEDDSFYDWDQEEWFGGAYLGEFKAVTDSKGEARISFKPSKDSKHTPGSTYRLSASVSVSDPSGRYFSANGSVVVAPSAVSVRAGFEQYVVQLGESAVLRVQAIDRATGKPKTGSEVFVEYGYRQWRGSKYELVDTQKLSAKTDADGSATFEIDFDRGGSVEATVSVADSKGRKTETRAYLWVWENGAKLSGSVPSLQIVLDRKEYETGDTAKAIIRTSRPGGSALVTIEADGILFSRVVPLDSESVEVEWELDEKYRPNVEVNVAYIRDKSFSQASRNMRVAHPDDELRVTVTADKEVARPGEVVRYTVETRDVAGRPVSSDVSLTVVDEAIYAIREDRDDPLRAFYPSRWSNVRTSYSFPDVYLDGDDKAPVDMEVRRNFKDTAFWLPSVITGSDGRATVAVKLPDNVTKWRATATAISADTRVGKSRETIVAKLPLMVRLSPPAFFVQDDVQTVGSVITNGTSRAFDVSVRLEVENLELLDEASQRIRLKPDESKTVSWRVKAGDPGSAKFTVLAWNDELHHRDGLERQVTVAANGPTLRTYRSGSTTSSASASFEIEQDVVAGSVSLTIAPSILSSLLSSIDDLVKYPYGCVEQTMNRFMPAVVTLSLLRDTGQSRPELEDRIADVSKKSLVRLRKMQHYDGGWGWWETDSSDAGMTALVLDGLYRAREAGLPIDPNMMSSGMSWAQDYFDQARSLAFFDDALHLALVLARENVLPGIALDRLRTEPLNDRTSTIALARIARIYWHLREQLSDVDAERMLSAYDLLIDRATETASAMSWSDVWWYSPTGEALLAVQALEPSSDRPLKILKYLMQSRRGGSWTSTRDTAVIVIGASQYVRDHEELRTSFSVDLRMDGANVRTIAFTAGSIQPVELELPISGLNPGEHHVTIVVRGEGQAYYTLDASRTIYQPKTTSRPGPTLRIIREYFGMKATRLEDGSTRLLRSKQAQTTFKSGEVLRCRLTIISEQAYEYVMIRDPSLSNCRIVEADSVNVYSWRSWYSNQDFYDDHAAFFMRRLPKGKSVIEYAVRAEAIGTASALPAEVSLMYMPEIRASSATSTIEVRK